MSILSKRQPVEKMEVAETKPEAKLTPPVKAAESSDMLTGVLASYIEVILDSGMMKYYKRTTVEDSFKDKAALIKARSELVRALDKEIAAYRRKLGSNGKTVEFKTDDVISVFKSDSIIGVEARTRWAPQ